MATPNSNGTGLNSTHENQKQQKSLLVRDVWKYNAMAAVQEMEAIAQDFPIISVDTEFPGVVYNSVGTFEDHNDKKYELLKANVDLMKVIQIGFTFFDGKGNNPPGVSTFQFNLEFSLKKDIYSYESITFLSSCGLNFNRHQIHGINHREFAALLLNSSLIFENTTWITFHGSYDFAYLLKILTNERLPVSKNKFSESLRFFFPVFYDVKYLAHSCPYLKGGLQDIATYLGVARAGSAHQAGSDAHLTGLVYFKLKNTFLPKIVDKFKNKLFGLNV